MTILATILHALGIDCNPPQAHMELLLDNLAVERGEPLDWRHSVVDLMKTLGLDGSFANRRALAEELGYDGDLSEGAAMNTWLRLEIMRRVAENGGKVPEELLST